MGGALSIVNFGGAADAHVAAGAVLAEWGADVVKVEHAVTGDPLAQEPCCIYQPKHWDAELENAAAAFAKP